MRLRNAERGLTETCDLHSRFVFPRISAHPSHFLLLRSSFFFLFFFFYTLPLATKFSKQIISITFRKTNAATINLFVCLFSPYIYCHFFWIQYTNFLKRTNPSLRETLQYIIFILTPNSKLFTDTQHKRDKFVKFDKRIFIRRYKNVTFLFFFFLSSYKRLFNLSK